MKLDAFDQRTKAELVRSVREVSAVVSDRNRKTQVSCVEQALTPLVLVKNRN